MRRLRNQLRSEYFGNISIQLIGTGIAQLIPFLVSPILTRLYLEESFATLTIFMATVSVLVVPNGGRYYYAMVIPKDDAEAMDLGKLSFWLIIFYNCLLLLIIFIFYNELNRFYELNELWLLMPLYVALFGVYNIVLYLSVRQKFFSSNAVAKIVQTVSTSAFSILFSLFGLINSGMVFGKTIGMATSIPFFKVKLDLKTDMKQLKAVAEKYVDYPKFTILPALLDVFSVQALIFFVGKYYSEETLGYLGLTNIILVAPIALIGVSFRDVFYQKIATFFIQRENIKAQKLFFGSAAVLFVIGGVIALTLFFFGEPIFSFIYGVNWLQSGKFAVILSFSLWAKLCASPLSSIFNATNQLKLLSAWQTAYFFTTGITLYFAIIYLELPIEQTLIIYTVHEVLLYTLYFFIQKQALEKFRPH